MLSFLWMKSILILFTSLALIGCGTVKKRELHSFHFPPGKSLPSVNDTNRFRAIVKCAQANTNITLIVNGNMYPANQPVTDHRVWVVANALHNAGIEADRIYIKEPIESRSHVPNNQWFTVVVVF